MCVLFSGLWLRVLILLFWYCVIRFLYALHIFITEDLSPNNIGSIIFPLRNAIFEWWWQWWYIPIRKFINHIRIKHAIRLKLNRESKWMIRRNKQNDIKIDGKPILTLIHKYIYCYYFLAFRFYSFLISVSVVVVVVVFCCCSAFTKDHWILCA